MLVYLFYLMLISCSDILMFKIYIQFYIGILTVLNVCVFFYKFKKFLNYLSFNILISLKKIFLFFQKNEKKKILNFILHVSFCYFYSYKSND